MGASEANVIEIFNQNIRLSIKNASEIPSAIYWHQRVPLLVETVAVSKRFYQLVLSAHDDVIKWKHFPRYWPIVRGIHRSPVNSPHKGQWRGALMFSLICAWINGWVSNREAGDLRRHRTHYDVTVMCVTVVGHLLWMGYDIPFILKYLWAFSVTVVVAQIKTLSWGYGDL